MEKHINKTIRILLISVLFVITLIGSIFFTSSSNIVNAEETRAPAPLYTYNSSDYKMHINLDFNKNFTMPTVPNVVFAKITMSNNYVIELKSQSYVSNGTALAFSGITTSDTTFRFFYVMSTSDFGSFPKNTLVFNFDVGQTAPYVAVKDNLQRFLLRVNNVNFFEDFAYEKLEIYDSNVLSMFTLTGAPQFIVENGASLSLSVAGMLRFGAVLTQYGALTIKSSTMYIYKTADLTNGYATSSDTNYIEAINATSFLNNEAITLKCSYLIPKHNWTVKYTVLFKVVLSDDTTLYTDTSKANISRSVKDIATAVIANDSASLTPEQLVMFTEMSTFNIEEYNQKIIEDFVKQNGYKTPQEVEVLINDLTARISALTSTLNTSDKNYQKSLNEINDLNLQLTNLKNKVIQLTAENEKLNQNNSDNPAKTNNKLPIVLGCFGGLLFIAFLGIIVNQIKKKK